MKSKTMKLLLSLTLVLCVALALPGLSAGADYVNSFEAGTDIGSNCIIGAGAVVKGHIPEGSVVIGNPARVVADTRQWAQSHWERKDFERHPKRVSAASTGKNTPQK